MAVVEQGGLFTLGIIDQTKETEDVSFHTPTSTLVNLAANETAQNALRDAVDDLILGGIYKEVVTISREVEFPLNVPADGTAQAEIDWLLLYQDNVTFKQYVMRLPTPDTATEAFRKPNSNFADTAHANWVAMKAAWAAIVYSVDGNPTTLVDAGLTSDGRPVSARDFYKVIKK